MKNTLYASKATDKNTAFFFGALFPYAISWAMYQGKYLLNLLNYAGLVINGLVAFILPLLLTLQATHIHSQTGIPADYTPLEDEMERLHESEDVALPQGTREKFVLDDSQVRTNESLSLPLWLIPYRREIIIFIIASYIAIIVSTVIANTVDFIYSFMD